MHGSGVQGNFQGDSVLTWIHKIVVDHKSCTRLRSYYEEWIGRLGQGLGADLWFLLPAFLCLLTLLLLPALDPGAPISPAKPISQAYSLALYMQKNTSTLLQTYVSDTGHEHEMRGEGHCLPGPDLCRGNSKARRKLLLGSESTGVLLTRDIPTWMLSLMVGNVGQVILFLCLSFLICKIGWCFCLCWSLSPVPRFKGSMQRKTLYKVMIIAITTLCCVPYAMLGTLSSLS